MFETKEEIKKSYERKSLVNEYDKKRFEIFGFKIAHLEEISFVNEAIKNTKSKTIMEIAPGTGRISKNLKGFEKAIGIDTSKEMLEYARKQIKNSNWTLKEGSIFDIKEKKLDLILCFRLLRHFHLKDRIKSYEQIRKALKKEGILVFDVLNKNRGQIGNLIDKIKHKIIGEGTSIYDKYYTKKEIENELNNNGFEILALRGVSNHYSFLFSMSLLARINFINTLLNKTLLKKVLRIDRSHHKSKKPFSWVVVAKKK